MTEKILVQKASGEKEAFSEDKLRNSLGRSGASEGVIDQVVDDMKDILEDGITTKEIYGKAFRMLRKRVRSHAARYSLKKAIMELGPTGFPFEKFIGEILNKQGYTVQVGVTLQGRCVRHEVDVVAKKDQEVIMAECKYHNSQGKISGVQIPLYIQSRFHDIEQVWRIDPGNQNKHFHGWVVTNTRFSTDATEYGACAGLKLIGWDYPRRGSLKEMIENSGLFPVTVITGLNRRQKALLLERNIVLCREISDNPGLIAQLDLDKQKQKRVLEEIEGILPANKSS